MVAASGEGRMRQAPQRSTMQRFLIMTKVTMLFLMSLLMILMMTLQLAMMLMSRMTRLVTKIMLGMISKAIMTHMMNIIRMARMLNGAQHSGERINDIDR